MEDAEADAPARRRTSVIHTDSMYEYRQHLVVWMGQERLCKEDGESAMNLTC
jgi:hypothetical protein